MALRWTIGRIYATYPWHRHSDMANALGYYLCDVSNHGTAFRIRSNDCSGFPMLDGSACPSCKKVSAVVDRLAELAKHVEPHTNHKYLNAEQLCALLKEKDLTIHQTRLEVSYLQPRKARSR